MLAAFCILHTCQGICESAGQASPGHYTLYVCVCVCEWGSLFGYASVFVVFIWLLQLGFTFCAPGLWANESVRWSPMEMVRCA